MNMLTSNYHDCPGSAGLIPPSLPLPAAPLLSLTAATVVTPATLARIPRSYNYRSNYGVLSAWRYYTFAD